MNYVEKLLSKDGRIGSRYIWSDFQKREKYAHFKEWLQRRDLQRRNELAKNGLPANALEIEQSKGFLALEDHNFPEATAITKAAQTILDEDPNFSSRGNKKPQLIAGLLKKDTLDLSSPFLKLALREDILATVSSYLGTVPILSNIDVWYSKSSEGLSNSQLYHLDWAAQSQIKLFVYASDVTSASGPLVLMEADSSSKLQEKIGYNYGEGVQDEVVAQHIGAKYQHEVTGKKGTVVFADTSRCFHYGSRVKGSDQYRAATMIQFLKPQSFLLPVNYRKAAPFQHLITPELSEIQRLVLGGK